METGKLTRIIREMKSTHSTDKSIESKLKVWIDEFEKIKKEAEDLKEAYDYYKEGYEYSLSNKNTNKNK